MAAPGAAAPGVSSARRLLARLRDVMAGTGSPQARLDKIVRLIAAEMVAEVCSCYLIRPGEVLELFATVGLNPEAVHRTRLRVGEGLVGAVAVGAQAIALADAPSHPSFAYRPETGEDPFQSFLGVPILRQGKVRGVLTIQNQRRRTYPEEEVETLQTIAMVVAELAVGGEMGGKGELASPEAGASMPARLVGQSLNPGLAQGLAVLHRPQVTIRQMVAEDVDHELSRFQTGLETMRSSLDQLLARTAQSGIADTRDILETYRMFAEDRGWLGRIAEAIRTGLTAEAAIQRVRNDMSARMAHLTDPYIRERLYDFEDLANRLLLHLSGKTSAAASGTLPEDCVLIARSIGPAELLDYEEARLRALVLEEGSQASHVAIVAKALDIPVIGRCAGIMALADPLDPVIVDADNGQIFVRPAEDVQEVFNRNLVLRGERRRAFAETSRLPAVTRDGIAVSIQLNAGLLVDLPHLKETAADGIGLYRTEIPFMVRAEYPDVRAQTELYARVMAQAEGKPVVFRTLDVGGDKRLPYFGEIEQENPALGWRAIRIGLDRPAMLRQQLRALIRAAAGRPLSVMFPMIADVVEFERARALLDMELARATDDGSAGPPARVSVGVMVEVPSLIWQLPAILERVDFLSVGTNDLLQYLFACDRGNPRLANRYDTLSPAFLAALARLAGAADRAGVPITVCGEMAGRPIEAMALLGLGFRRLSMSPAGVGPVKAMIRCVTLEGLAEYMTQLIGTPTYSLRSNLRNYAQDHGIPF
ncbi:MAG: phosphoenolpyruvate--protein phosphotransferase [Alphaproteobacteria bacterium]|jgi:phosphotransferase system enzyme I (PtsP)|nr:phosphoenolpyruvate--protein phosphotransferase [Alphaproteobacteria bacterium]